MPERDYAAVAVAIAEFEPVVMVCRPGDRVEVANLCGSDLTVVELPVNDSWARDSGPIGVHNERGEPALVSFRFNAWGNRWHPHDDDDALAPRLADLFGLPWFQAPFVLEGGSFFVDGEGQILVTEQCLLNPNRNPELSRDAIARGLCDYLGGDRVMWLPYGHTLDTGPTGTDGHIDGVLQYVGPAHVMLEAPSDPASPDHACGLANLEVLNSARDSHERSFTVSMLDPGPDARVSYANHYLPNGGVVVPVAGDPGDEAALARLAEIYPDRRVVGVPGTTIACGGGGPHCITQQLIAGVALP